jgi:hypothetical protein
LWLPNASHWADVRLRHLNNSLAYVYFIVLLIFTKRGFSVVSFRISPRPHQAFLMRQDHMKVAASDRRLTIRHDIINRAPIRIRLWKSAIPEARCETENLSEDGILFAMDSVITWHRIGNPSEDARGDCR